MVQICLGKKKKRENIIVLLDWSWCVAIGDVEAIAADRRWTWHASLISAIITQLHRLRGFEVVLSKGSFSRGMPHPDSVCNARSILLWDVQTLSAQLRCRFERVSSEWTGGEDWKLSAESLLSVLLHMSKAAKWLEWLVTEAGIDEAHLDVILSLLFLKAFCLCLFRFACCGCVTVLFLFPLEVATVCSSMCEVGSLVFWSLYLACIVLLCDLDCCLLIVLVLSGLHLD